MPKTSKIRSASTKPKPAAPVENERSLFYCCRCTRHFKKQKGNFPASQSSIYRANGAYLTICNHCVDELFEHYKGALGDECEAIRRVCLKFDIYWHPAIYDMLYKANTSQSRVRAYISKTNLLGYVGKTYDDTIDEERAIADEKKAREDAIVKVVAPVYNEKTTEETLLIDEEVIKYWGTGFKADMYSELENRRDYWLSQYPPETVLNPGEEGILRQICNLEILINKEVAAGRPAEKMINTLNSLFGSMNIKPSQKREIEENYAPFGVEIARWEDEYPVIDPDDDFKDVDNLRHNVISWFLGSLCKTVGMKNEYSRYFEEEIAKYTVERPEYDDEEGTGDCEDGGDSDEEIHA